MKTQAMALSRKSVGRQQLHQLLQGALSPMSQKKMMTSMMMMMMMMMMIRALITGALLRPQSITRPHLSALAVSEHQVQAWLHSQLCPSRLCYHRRPLPLRQTAAPPPQLSTCFAVRP
jgi:hypothetical protein